MVCGFCQEEVSKCCQVARCGPSACSSISVALHSHVQTQSFRSEPGYSVQWQRLGFSGPSARGLERTPTAGRGALTQPTGQQGGEHLIEMFNMLFLFLKLKLFKANICVNFGALLGLKFQLMQCYDAVL